MEEYDNLLKGIWDRNWLTNDGPMVRQLESRLADELNVDDVIFVANGTIALQIAMKAMGLSGEVITTPFSYVATTSSIFWENMKPVFVDIDPETLTMDPAHIDEKITRETSAIVATHVFGNPCDVRAIQDVATRNSLNVIYDAAHAYGSRFDGKSVMRYGDVTCISFHATKLFHTVEGGAIITSDADLAYRCRKMRNFGHDGPMRFDGVGINGKNSEFHAAMGLVNLNYIDQVMSRRKAQVDQYRDLLKNAPVVFPQPHTLAENNAAYCAVIFPTENDLLKVESALSGQGIGSRRYFNPSLNTLEYLEPQSCPISEDLCQRVLCLPVYHELTREEISEICQIANTVFNFV